MARQRGLSFQRTSRGSRRQTDWGFGPGGTAVTSFSASGSAVLGSGIEPTSLLTLVRTRGLVEIFIKGLATADGDGYTGAVAIGLASDPAFTAGIASLPTPITELNWDGWLWHSFFSVHATDISFGDSGSGHQRIVIDSKAMRKFSPENVMFAAAEVVEQGTVNLDVYFDSRMLFKET